MGAAIGSAVGGVLTQLTGYVRSLRLCAATDCVRRQTWRSTFWFLTGLSVLCGIGAVFSIDQDLPYALDDKRVDWLGAFLVTAGLTFIVFVLSDGPTAPDGWKTGCESISRR